MKEESDTGGSPWSKRICTRESFVALMGHDFLIGSVA